MIRLLQTVAATLITISVVSSAIAQTSGFGDRPSRRSVSQTAQAAPPAQVHDGMPGQALPPTPDNEPRPAGSAVVPQQQQIVPPGRRQSIPQTSGPAVAPDASPDGGPAETNLNEPQPAIRETAPPPKSVASCLRPEDIPDRDGDFRRNATTLASNDLCLKLDVFRESGLTWTVQIIQSKRNPDPFLWFVPHDNENDAFDTAVHAVKNYGGTVVAIETGGARFNGRQDPNRNFDAGGQKCREQTAHSPIYTDRILRWRSDGAPIIALHTNERGFNGDGNGGAGGISIARPLPGSTAFRGKGPALGLSPDDTVVFVASTQSPQSDSNLMRFVRHLQDNRINVLYETVTRARNDCSLSNYAALQGIRDYVNIEVVQGDGDTQTKVLKQIVKEFQTASIGPIDPVGKPDDGNARLPANEVLQNEPLPPANGPKGNPQTLSPAGTPSPPKPLPAAPAAANQNPSQNENQRPDSSPSQFFDRFKGERTQPQPSPTPDPRGELKHNGRPDEDRGRGSLFQRAPQQQQGGAGASTTVFFAQLAAPPSELQAKRLWQAIQTNSEALIGMTPQFQEHQGNHRILVGPYETRQQATALCKKVGSMAPDCFPQTAVVASRNR